MLLNTSEHEGILRGLQFDQVSPTYWVNVCLHCRVAFEFRTYRGHSERSCRKRHRRVERQVWLCGRCRYGLVFADDKDHYEDHRCFVDRDGRLWAEPTPSFVIPHTAFAKSPLDPADVVAVGEE
ncbi:hypothetical protein [Kutzneria sp. CA-103260]|uniref:hypothetical protein n=1 Tax=Kutzneria sp. CA-103260 TaxID=2802641 RepID=UPI001BAC4F1B|nr:hypothetical protein [Kutzneria sp. CA-103260]QUQ66606.1 hypothetical protein JJ691_43340 [Kutzneria sp. CA-103260]